MIVECAPEGRIRLTDPFDFRRFKLVLTGGASAGSGTWRGIDLVDDHNALVSVDLVPRLSGRPEDESWEPAFARMVEKAREHGWIDHETNAIRAHVERRP
jgi:hypothetical protein